MFRTMYTPRFFEADSGADGGNSADGSNQSGADSAATKAADQASTTTENKGPSAEEVRASMLKDIGIDDFDSLKSIVEDHNKQVAANQTELEAAKTNFEKANTALGKANSRAEAAEAKLSAFQLGVSNDHLSDALALAKADMADKDKGVKTIDDALKGVLARNPAFKGEQAAKTNADGTAVADQNLGGNPPKTMSLDDFLKLPTVEQNNFQRQHPQEFANIFK